MEDHIVARQAKKGAEPVRDTINKFVVGRDIAAGNGNSISEAGTSRLHLTLGVRAVVDKHGAEAAVEIS